MKSVIRTVGLLLVTIISGCVHTTPKYNSNLPVNMVIETTLDKKPEAYVAFDIIHIDRKCKLTLDGRVELNTGSVSIGLPTGEPLYLEFIFARSNGSVREGAILTLRPGSKYNADVSYIKGIYSAELYETRPGDGKKRKVTMIPLQACKPS